jgi:DNA primase
LVRYDEDMIQEISDGVDLLEYISQSIELKQKSKDYFGTCPLHPDLTPSFSVTPKKNSFFCFSCGRGGGIIQYLHEYESLTYDDAIEKASKLANIDLKTMCQSQTVLINKKIKKEKQINISNIKHDILKKDEFNKYRKGIIKEWLEEGIRQEEIDLYEIRIDDRSNRIIYPVYDTDNNFINIKGRTLFSDYKKMGICKYINYFSVGVMDYFQGLNITLPYIKETKEVKIFESIKSVMKLFGNGIKDSASAEKHTLTNEQIIYLIKLRVDVVLCYDSDVSYKEKEVVRNINMLKRFTNVYIIEDKNGLLGGVEAKNSPIDKGINVWNELYSNKKKIL